MVYNSENAATFDQFFKDISWGPITVHTMSQYNEILELEYSGWPIKRIVLFQCKWFDPTSRGTRELKQHNIIEVKHTRKYEAYDPFIIAQNAKQVYYAPYPLRGDKSDWWVVIKTKPMGRVDVENELDVAYQNEISSVHQVVDVELEISSVHQVVDAELTF
ncbi:hypothetical protein AABB24_010517 [Solanum stoloniferum]|uniref:DUF4216 domain-containing protein n=2 Tax=Solanum stoloniferum TaxID=62892 RepID=A0ABD2UCU0_9SOLN